MRNGTREKLVATVAGDITLKIPKVRSASFFPSPLAPGVGLTARCTRW